MASWSEVNPALAAPNLNHMQEGKKGFSSTIPVYTTFNVTNPKFLAKVRSNPMKIYVLS